MTGRPLSRLDPGAQAPAAGAAESDHFRRPILVLGPPRSGTSLVAGCLACCGAWLGHTFGAAPANPKGFFESVQLREGVNKAILTALGCDPLGVADLPPLDGLPVQPEMREAILAAIRGEGYAGAGPWLFKDAKLTLLWPVWRAMFPDARWVIVRRREDDVVRSCLNTDFMVQHSSDPAFWRRFIAAYDERLDRLKAAGPWWREIQADALVGGDLAALRARVEALELTWDQAAVTGFITPGHWHAAD